MMNVIYATLVVMALIEGTVFAATYSKVVANNGMCLETINLEGPQDAEND